MIAALALVAVMVNGSGVTIDPLDFGAPEVTAFASPSEVRLGQEITLVVSATYGNNVEVNLPDPLFPAGAPLEIAHRDSVDRVRTDGRHVREWQLRVYPWELGEFDIPPIQVTFQAGGRVATVATNAIPIRVIEVVGGVDDPKQMRAMSPAVPLWSRSWFLLWLAGGGTTTLAIAIYFAFFYRRRKRRERARDAKLGALAESPLAESTEATEGDAVDGEAHVDQPAPVVVAPPPKRVVQIVRARRKLDRIAEEALARLRALELSGRLDSDRRGAYRDMVAIIRDYLAARFDVDAPELTTRELCQALTFRSAAAAGLTRAWLAECDVVKYAGTSTTGDQARTSLDGAVWLIDRTSPGTPADAPATAPSDPPEGAARA